ncbi:hypothetical protein GQ44DRAFT_831133 [Phaeosphaeriaceae sp. PMI808]|nr:hypothetical protein GQ44DRAFT_831133 [Phaeosphaeriaceae sp. PMI808]
MVSDENVAILSHANLMAVSTPPVTTGPAGLDGGSQSPTNDDAKSESSTNFFEDFGYEPFETFRNKIADLSTKYFESDVKIEHMHGGTFYRVVAVSGFAKSEKSHCFGCPKPEKYVILSPRDYEGEIDDDVTSLKFVNLHVSLPTPRIIAYDRTRENAVKQPYLILERLPGEDLSRLWKTLNMAQKHSIAKQVATFAPTIALTNGPLGFPTVSPAVSPTASPTEKPILAREFPISDGPRNRTTSTQEPALTHLLNQIKLFRADELKDGMSFEQVWNGFEVICHALKARGFLDGPCVLVHPFLCHISNIIAAVASDVHADITGVIDWNEAIFAPEFMAYQPPYWMWTSEADLFMKTEKDYVDVEPDTEEGRALKQDFIDSATEIYLKFAFAPEAVIARQMFPILQGD